MRVAELTERLHVPYRHVRYVLEQGILPQGVAETPGRGEHRDLSPAQAFWLAIVLALKENGIKTPLAGRIADYCEQTVRGVADRLNWEHTFDPFRGRFDTVFEWFIEIGDLKLVRIATTSNPSHDGLYVFPWFPIGKKRAVPDAAPLVVIRLDLARLGQLLQA